MSGNAKNVTCLFCNAEIKNGKGNSPEPYFAKEDGFCCDECKEFYITPARQGYSDLALERFWMLMFFRHMDEQDLADILRYLDEV